MLSFLTCELGHVIKQYIESYDVVKENQCGRERGGEREGGGIAVWGKRRMEGVGIEIGVLVGEGEG